RSAAHLKGAQATSNEGAGQRSSPQPRSGFGIGSKIEEAGGRGLPPASAKRKGYFWRLNRATYPTPAERRLEFGVEAGLAAGIAVPVLFKAASAVTMVVSFPLALAAMVVTFGLMTVYRLARFLITGRTPGSGQAPRRLTMRGAVALGLVLGLGLGAAPRAFHKAITEKVTAVYEVEKGRRVRGGAFEAEAIAALADNPAGRRVLDGLRDRFGRVHLPVFMVSEGQHEDTVAVHLGIFDGVFIDAREIRGYGWSVDEFLSDPAKQRQFVRDYLDFVGHELWHAAQARASWGNLVPGPRPMEDEHEAYLIQHFINHERLKRDPSALGSELVAYEDVLDDLDAYFRDLAQAAAYQGRPSGGRSAAHERFMSEVRAGWTAHRIEGYELLSQRYERFPRVRDRYLQKAEALRTAPHGQHSR
ncbi:MAG: hypothetical protein HY554_02590, partial [Elusimicrobia bacterium]|nr:hypothetical protein [Elusimicrobiota bacterium]